jgi:hypothetical protein
MRYKSTAFLEQEARETHAWFRREWESIERVVPLTKALLGSGDGALAKAVFDKKVASTDAELARVDATELRKEYPNLAADSLQSLAQGHRMAKLLAEYSRRNDAIAEQMKRSRRYSEAWRSTNGAWPPTIH